LNPHRIEPQRFLIFLFRLTLEKEIYVAKSVTKKNFLVTETGKRFSCCYSLSENLERIAVRFDKHPPKIDNGTKNKVRTLCKICASILNEKFVKFYFYCRK